MEFKQALCPLSKPSEFAASTENSEHDGALVANKDCLYINTYITKAFRKAVTKSNVNDFILLCGFSGDCKSENHIRYSKGYQLKKAIHTYTRHNLNPSQIPVQILNESFYFHKSASRSPFVCRLNNNVEEGRRERYSDIKGLLKEEI